ncbi:MAG: S8 family serine peptidase [Firmicutes bacterium]|nr:S8 family serine peptidase [Bacillota bacterium]
MVAAAGNKPETPRVDFPARLRGVLGVGATTIDDKIADFSSGGIGLDLVAPGENILERKLPGAKRYFNGRSPRFRRRCPAFGPGTRTRS